MPPIRANSMHHLHASEARAKALAQQDAHTIGNFAKRTAAHFCAHTLAPWTGAMPRGFDARALSPVRHTLCVILVCQMLDNAQYHIRHDYTALRINEIHTINRMLTAYTLYRIEGK